MKIKNWLLTSWFNFQAVILRINSHWVQQERVRARAESGSSPGSPARSQCLPPLTCPSIQEFRTSGEKRPQLPWWVWSEGRGYGGSSAQKVKRSPREGGKGRTFAPGRRKWGFMGPGVLCLSAESSGWDPALTGVVLGWCWIKSQHTGEGKRGVCRKKSTRKVSWVSTMVRSF